MDEGINLGSAYVMLGADVTELKRQLKEAENAATQSATKISGGFQQSMAGMATKLKSFAAQWMALPVAIGAAIFAVQQLGAEFGRLYNMAKEGAKDLRMEETFRNVAESVGADADAMTQKMVKATGRAVQETVLQATAMRGMLGGINEKTLTDLSGAAKIFARSTGQATGDVFNQMVNSVIMQMPRQLMRLRVITREEMREIQKAISMGAIGKEDIAAEIVRKAEERGKQMKIAAYDMFSAFSRFGRAWDELIEAGGKLMALVFVPLLEILAPTIDLITGLANVLLGILLPVLKPVFQGLKEVGEMAYDTAARLKELWDQVDKGKKTLEDLAGEGPIMGLLLTSMRGWKNLAEAIQAAVDALEKWQRLINEAKAGGPGMSPLDNKPSTTFFDRPTLVPWLGKDASAKREAAEIEQIHTTSLLAQRAREVQYEQATLKMKLEVAKQENAIKLELVKARHTAELKLFDIQSKHEIEMAKRGGATSQEAFNMEMTATAKKNSMTEQNARKEAGVKASIARQEMELEIKIENEKNKYKAETMDRERQLAEKTAPGSPAAYAKLQELTAFVTHYKRLEQITREGKERIIRARYGGDIEQAALNAKVAAAELAVTKKERGSIEEMKSVQAAQTVTFEKMSLDTRISTLNIEEKIANVKMDQDEGLIGEIAAQEKLLVLEIERYNRLKEEEKIINERAKILETISGKKFDPFKDSLGDLLRMNEEIQNGSQYNDIIKATWKEITDKIVENYEALKKGKTVIEQTASAMERMKTAAIMEVGPTAGVQWFAEQVKTIEARKKEFRKAKIDETSISRWEIEQQRQIQLQYYQWQLENATNLNEAMSAKAKIMLDEVRNAYTAWANAVADSMQRSFSDFFFDVMEGKVKSLKEYLTSFTQSMNRQIADFLSKKFTGEVLKLVFGMDETQNMNVATMQVAMLNVNGTTGLAVNMPTGGTSPVVESSGFTGAISDMWGGIKDWFGGLDIFHDGGVVGASSDSKKLAGGLQHDEMIAVLQKGEVVIPKGGISDFIDKYSRAGGGPVQAGMQYLMGENGRELFAPSYGGPRLSNVAAHKAEEAYAAKRVSLMEAKELAQYKKEYDEYRKYELERDAWEKEQRDKANQQQEQGGGLLSSLPTILSMLALKYGGNTMAGLTWLGDLLGITSVASPTVGGASAGAGVTMGSFMELEAASMLTEAPVAGWMMEAGASTAAASSAALSEAGYLTAEGAAEWAAAEGASYGSGAFASGGTAMGATELGAGIASFATPLAFFAASYAAFEGINSVLSMISGEGKHLQEYTTPELLDSWNASGSGNIPLWYELQSRGATSGLMAPTEQQTADYYDWYQAAGTQGSGWAAKGGDFGAGRRLVVGEIGRELFIPHYATGGTIAARKASLIGEQGPEIFVPQVSGTIIPNNLTEKILGMTNLFSGDGIGGFVANAIQQGQQSGMPIGWGENILPMNSQPTMPTGTLEDAGIATMGFVGSYFNAMSQGPEIAMRARGGHVSGGSPYIVGEGGVEAFLSNIPRFHSGGVVGGGEIPNMVPNQIVNVTNRVDGKQQASPVAQNNTVHVNVQSLDGADAYRVLSNNRDALASIFSEMRLDNNSRLRR